MQEDIKTDFSLTFNMRVNFKNESRHVESVRKII